MDPNAEKLMAAALALPSEARAFIAERLIESLDALDDAEIERLWLDEAEKRFSDYKQGKISARSADDVFRDARSSLQ